MLFFLALEEEYSPRVLTSVQAGGRGRRPDFWVVRVGLLGVAEDALVQLCKLVRACQFSCVAPYARATEIDARRRYAAQSADKKYINVAGGASDDANLGFFAQQLRLSGFAAEVVPGPLLLATTGGKYPKIKMMPLSVDSTGAPTAELLRMAHGELNKPYGLPGMAADPDLDLPANKPAKWSTHSLRRLADTTARRYAKLMDVSEQQIDIYFGWHEKILLKNMQIHYASLSVRERMLLARITGML